MSFVASSSSSALLKLEKEEPIEGTLSAAATTFKLPGQRYPTPSPGNGDRVFYETLLNQRPDSEMAQEWCVYYGVLDTTNAAALCLLIQTRRGLKGPLSVSPSRPTPVKASRSPATVKKAPAKKAPAKKAPAKKPAAAKDKKEKK